MKNKILLILGIAALVAVGVIVALNIQNGQTTYSFSPDSINGASTETGDISEKIIGNLDEATLVVYEYADFSCAHCASWNRKINELVKESDGKLAVIFRYFNLNLTKNSPVAARAATAAQIQGYFDEYKDLLFNNQSEWEYVAKDKAIELFVEYFSQASNGTGDLEKFKNDLNSSAVKKRLDYEQNMGKKVNLEGTPLFRINGETVPLDTLLDTIKNAL
ncbi:thioredoxin domain-containing protein [Candidatus Saccharibacteria bacterium]|nr:thioredoxin domain-containing protein [Candidatus Saccharibacteria bacterium]